jgi:hypothetical protein
MDVLDALRWFAGKTGPVVVLDVPPTSVQDVQETYIQPDPRMQGITELSVQEGRSLRAYASVLSQKSGA